MTKTRQHPRQATQPPSRRRRKAPVPDFSTPAPTSTPPDVVAISSSPDGEHSCVSRTKYTFRNRPFPFVFQPMRPANQPPKPLGVKREVGVVVACDKKPPIIQAPALPQSNRSQARPEVSVRQITPTPGDAPNLLSPGVNTLTSPTPSPNTLATATLLISLRTRGAPRLRAAIPAINPPVFISPPKPTQAKSQLSDPTKTASNQSENVPNSAQILIAEPHAPTGTRQSRKRGLAEKEDHPPTAESSNIPKPSVKSSIADCKLSPSLRKLGKRVKVTVYDEGSSMVKSEGTMLSFVF